MEAKTGKERRHNAKQCRLSKQIILKHDCLVGSQKWSFIAGLKRLGAFGLATALYSLQVLETSHHLSAHEGIFVIPSGSYQFS